MAWTTPSAVSAGTAILATWGNTYLVDNLNYLKQEVDKYGALLADGVEVAISNSAAETTIFTGTVPGNTLGTAQMLMIHTFFRYQNNSGGALTFTWRIKYGGTTMVTHAFSVASGGANLYGRIEAVLRGDGTTSAQELTSGLIKSEPSSPSFVGYHDTGTAAVDSTADQTLLITLQISGASASANYTSKGTIVEGPF